ncbi:MAG: GldG family protein [Anaerolineales bacterium]|jgi:ABC-type uncharacterized transport system involved in gliding motility auxiliary subunit|nr:GldG family protein [Anaerolineales bacterium]
MNDKFKKYGPLGLVLAGLALLSLAGFILTRALVAIQLVTLPDDKFITRGLWISAAVLALGLALTALLNPDGVRKFLTGRQVRYGSNSAILFLAALGILFFVNALVLDNPQTWDMTEDKQNTLAPETIAILDSLKEPVVARAYYSTQLSSDAAKKLLENFKQKSNGKFTYEFINPEFNPVLAEQDKVERDGSIVLMMQARSEVVTFAGERDLDSALLRLQNPGERFIYFVSGHGELSIETAGESAYTLVKRSLEFKNYTVLSLNLLSEGRVPENASALVIAGPQKPFSDSEMSALQAYLAQGGGLVIMKDVSLSAPAASEKDPLDGLLTEWGIGFNEDLIIDPNVNPAIIAIADPATYADHPVTRGLLGYYSAFPTSRSLKVISAPETVSVTPLAFTSANAWGETDFESLNNNTAQFDEGVDLSGPLILAVAAEDLTKNARMVVFGDSELAADAIYEQGNGAIAINAIDWAAEQEAQISLTPKESVERQYRQPGTFGLVAMLLGAVCILPLIIAGAGVSTWVARRKRG